MAWDAALRSVVELIYKRQKVCASPGSYSVAEIPMMIWLPGYASFRRPCLYVQEGKNIGFVVSYKYFLL